MPNASNYEWITILIAIYGAVLATFIALRDIFKSKYKIKILIHSVIFSEPKNDRILYISIYNHGPKDISLHSPFIELPGGMKLFSYDFKVDTIFPTTLKSGRSISPSLSYDELVNDLKNEGYRNNVFIRAVLHDELGNKYKSNKLEVNLNYTLK